MSQNVSSENHPNFIEFAPGVGSGNPPNREWCSIVDIPLVILVGVTGVGKSTTLQAVRDQKFRLTLLPNRRDLTDRLIITLLQQQAGSRPHLVTDRTERFRLTRQYREQFPGGMGHALSQLLVHQEPTPFTEQGPTGKQVNGKQVNGKQLKKREAWWFFDGLRGDNEVQAALRLLPQARFIVLDAPDAVRVQRLLGREDRFDQVALQAVSAPASPTTQTFAAIGIAEADSLFSAQERAWLFSRCAPPYGTGTVAIDDLRARLKIVAEERRNYDPSAALQALQQEASTRTLVIDTTSVDATRAAQQIIQWLA